MRYVSDEMGKFMLTTDSRGADDTGVPMAEQLLKSVITGFANGLDEICWFKLEQSVCGHDEEECDYGDPLDPCAIPFFDIEGSTSCPLPEYSGLSPNPRFSFTFFQKMNLHFNEGRRFVETVHSGDVRRYVFQDGEGEDPLEQVSYVWLHDHSDLSTQNYTFYYPDDSVVGVTLWRGDDQPELEPENIYFGGDASVIVPIDREPHVVRWLVATEVTFDDDVPDSTSWYVEQGESWTCRSVAVVNADTIDVTPWASVTKLSDVPSNSTSLKDHILTPLFVGANDTLDALIAMSFNSVRRDTLFFDVDRDLCTLVGTLDSVRIIPGTTITCQPPWISEAVVAKGYSHFGGSHATCNISANANVVWTSTDTTKVKVDTYGRITPVAGGSASVIVTFGGNPKRDTVTVNVED